MESSQLFLSAFDNIIENGKSDAYTYGLITKSYQIPEVPRLLNQNWFDPSTVIT